MLLLESRAVQLRLGANNSCTLHTILYAHLSVR